MAAILDRLFTDAADVPLRDPICDRPITSAMVRYELDCVDSDLRDLDDCKHQSARARAYWRMHPEDKVRWRDALEARRLELLTRVPR